MGSLIERKLKNTLVLKKLLLYQDYTSIRFVNMLIQTKSNATKHLVGKENLINKVWRTTAIIYMLSQKNLTIAKLITSIHASHQKNKWTTLLDNLNSSTPSILNTIPIYLLQMLHQELTLKGKDYKPFWTPVYRKLSEKLLLPTEIDSVDLDSNYSNPLSQNVEDTSQLLTINKIKVHNKNLQKTYYQLSTSTLVDKWESEDIPKQLKSRKIKIKITKTQKKVIDEWLHTTRFVYNKTVNEIENKKHNINFFSLRDKLVTNNTKKQNSEYINFTNELLLLNTSNKELCKAKKPNLIKIKELQTKIKELKTNFTKIKKELKSSTNESLHKWELNTPKDIRAAAVKDVCIAYKSGFTNLKVGNIKYFNMQYKKKTNPNKCLLIPQSMIKNDNGIIKIAPTYLKDNCNFYMGKKTIKKERKLEINHDCRLIKKRKDYWLIIPIPLNLSPKLKQPVNYCGIDPGIRTFMTTFGNDGCNEYTHNNAKLKKLDSQIKSLKNKNSRVLKRKITKREIRKDNIINEIHWKTINDLLTKYDILFYGDIKSHGVVKNKTNHNLNRDINNLKFYNFKERLLFKSIEKRKKIFFVKEHHTTQTCCFCGTINKPGTSKKYNCSSCKNTVGRDINASKNILMKGIIQNS